MYEMGRHIHARVLRSEKGCRIRVTYVHTRSDCVYTKNDTVRLNYASRFVRVIYSSHIVSIKLDTVTPLRRRKKRKEAQRGTSRDCSKNVFFEMLQEILKQLRTKKIGFRATQKRRRGRKEKRRKKKKIEEKNEK